MVASFSNTQNRTYAACIYFRWILQHRALQELDQKHCWFRPMMNAIALKLVGDVGWGLKLRVFVGAALSTFDLMTDIFITYTFKRDGRDTFFRYSVAMICSSIFFMVSKRDRTLPSPTGKYDANSRKLYCVCSVNHPT